MLARQGARRSTETRRARSPCAAPKTRRTIRTMATGFYSHPDCLLHDMGQWHPECPARLQAIEDQLIASRIDALIERESPPLADEAALLRVHTQAHVDYIRSRSPGE